MDIKEFRSTVRNGFFSSTTTGLCSENIHTNLVVLPQSQAIDFRRFCELNPGPCPLVEETLPGNFVPVKSAPGADLRTDLPLYRVYRHGKLYAEVRDVVSFWRDDLVSFLIGCSFNFEEALIAAGIPMRHQSENKVVPMYVTSIQCKEVGAFSGPLVVSMRPIPIVRVDEVRSITKHCSLSHGEPLHVGEASALGIVDIGKPEYGESVTIQDDEVPAFWACGVTPQAIAEHAALEFLITHSPGHMFVTDLRTSPTVY